MSRDRTASTGDDTLDDRHRQLTDLRSGGLSNQAEGGIREDLVSGVQTCAFFFQAEDGIRDDLVTGVQTCALPISYLEPCHFPSLALVATAARLRDLVVGTGPRGDRSPE